MNFLLNSKFVKYNTFNAYVIKTQEKNKIVNIK